MFPIQNQIVNIVGFVCHIWSLSHFLIRSLKNVKAQIPVLGHRLVTTYKNKPATEQ